MEKESVKTEGNVWEVVPVEGSVTGPELSSHEAVVHGDSMFLFGQGEVFTFNFPSSSWSKLTIHYLDRSSPSPSSNISEFPCPPLLSSKESMDFLDGLRGHKMLFHSFTNPTRNCLLITGGVMGGGYSDDFSPYTFTFDIDSDEMDQLVVSCASKEDFPTLRWRHGSAILPKFFPNVNSNSDSDSFDSLANTENLLIWGGRTPTGAIDQMHELNLKTKVWSEVLQAGEIPSARSSFGFCDFTNANGFYFFVYGGNTTPARDNKLYVFHYQTHIWTKLNQYFTAENALPSNRRQRMVIVKNRRMTIFGGSEDNEHVYHCSLDEILAACEVSKKDYQNRIQENDIENKNEDNAENIITWSKTSARPLVAHVEGNLDNEQKKEEFPSRIEEHIMVAYEGSLYLHSSSNPTLWKWRCPFLLNSLVHFVKQFMVVNNITV